ncbi:MAG: pectate lyase [Bacteroidales bacterium]|nr:pectate lyase [Bacteroidales bacterium]
MFRTYFILFIVIVFSYFGKAQNIPKGQILAFPEAEGYGKYTSGGRGGIVLEVTNLNDDGPGSFRNAINTDTMRTIVFKVSGIIELKTPLEINFGNLTIAGQTAPGDGICIKNWGVQLLADNIIIRYMRFRPGDKMKAEVDALFSKGNKNIIIDHCSMSWATDEVGSFYDNENFTLQWCIISESLNESYHWKGEHGYGGIWGGKGATFHHNLLASHSSRNPRFCGSRYHDIPEEEIVDYRNNVIFNWGKNSAYGGEAGSQNMVANYYKPGPATKGFKKYRIVGPSFDFINKSINPDTVPLGYWYITDNYVEGNSKVSANNWDGGVQGLSEEQVNKARLTQPVPFVPINEQKATEAYQLVLQNAGAILPKRDLVDQRIINEVKTGKTKFKNGIIDSQVDVGGWPEYHPSPTLTDRDHDGMPDEWEMIHGLNPDNEEDRNGDSDGDGYTNLEEYLNSIGKN